MFHRASVVSVVTCLILSFTIPVLAEDSTTVERIVPEIKALRINPETPVIDGMLDDEIWQDPKVFHARGFTQRDPDEGVAATESTLVAVRYDDDAVYFAFWCYDSEPEKIAEQLVRRDRHSEADMVSVRVDPYHDHQTGYAFYISAAGVQRDCRIYNDDHTDYSWDGVWDSGVRR
ncbi:MAG: carbohydrate binding family 9 domain-containing protein, partial [Planctomycetes bacterium]|nr:carbohydrate binding family 9 domain-containing protein [Planctomycetota bacterium]